MDYPEDVAGAATRESHPFLEKHDDLEQWPSKSAHSTSGKRVLDSENEGSFFRRIGLANAIGFILNVAIAGVMIAIWVLRRPSICSCSAGPWCMLIQGYRG